MSSKTNILTTANAKLLNTLDDAWKQQVLGFIRFIEDDWGIPIRGLQRCKDFRVPLSDYPDTIIIYTDFRFAISVLADYVFLGTVRKSNRTHMMSYGTTHPSAQFKTLLDVGEHLRSKHDRSTNNIIDTPEKYTDPFDKLLHNILVTRLRSSFLHSPYRVPFVFIRHVVINDKFTSFGIVDGSLLIDNAQNQQMSYHLADPDTDLNKILEAVL